MTPVCRPSSRRLSRIKHGLLNRLSWKASADAAKRRPGVLRVADALGRETGRCRLLDGVRPLPPTPRPDLTRFPAGDCGACLIGHATLLLRVGGFTVLTDPVFSPRVGLGYVLGTMGPRRMQAPAMTVDQLPPLDLILVSHAHFDHLDRPSLWRLARRFPQTPVLTASRCGDLIADLPFRDVREIDVGETATFGGLRARALRTVHWGPRVFFDRWRGYCAFALEAAGRRVVFGGDTADTRAFAEAAPCDLMAVGIGAYDPYVAAHATPEQAWRMTRDADARRVAAMHHLTFRLSHEPTDEPLRRLLAAAGDEADRVVVRRPGDVWPRDL